MKPYTPNIYMYLILISMRWYHTFIDSMVSLNKAAQRQRMPHIHTWTEDAVIFRFDGILHCGGVASSAEWNIVNNVLLCMGANVMKQSKNKHICISCFVYQVYFVSIPEIRNLYILSVKNVPRFLTKLVFHRNSRWNMCYNKLVTIDALDVDSMIFGILILY